MMEMPLGPEMGHRLCGAKAQFRSASQRGWRTPGAVGPQSGGLSEVQGGGEREQVQENSESGKK